MCMKYIIIDDRTGCRQEGSIGHMWNSMRDFHNSVRNIHYNCDIRALLLFFHEAIADDIFSLAYVQGEAEKGNEKVSEKSVSSFMRISDSRNEPLIRRQIELAFTEVEQATAALSRVEMSSSSSLDNYIKDKPEYLVELKVHIGFSDTSIAHLRNSIHDYVVSRVLWEWSKLTYPKFADYWQEKIDKDLVAIIEEADMDNYGKEYRVMPAW